MSSLLQRFTAHLPCRFIDGENAEPYLERYYLLGVLGWHLYLHRLVASDPDRGLHDHPWGRAVSLVLSGDTMKSGLSTAPRISLRPAGLVRDGLSGS